MDESALEAEFASIRRRQRIIISLLLVPYLIGLYTLSTVYGPASIVAVVLLGLVVTYVVVAIGRRRRRGADGGRSDADPSADAGE